MEEISDPVSVDREPGGEVREDQDADRRVRDLDVNRTRCKRGGDDEKDRHDIKNHQTVTEALGLLRVALVVFPESVRQSVHCFLAAAPREETLYGAPNAEKPRRSR